LNAACDPLLNLPVVDDILVTIYEPGALFLVLGDSLHNATAVVGYHWHHHLSPVANEQVNQVFLHAHVDIKNREHCNRERSGPETASANPQQIGRPGRSRWISTESGASCSIALPTCTCSRLCRRKQHAIGANIRAEC
jgi:hypothetical protein